MAEGPFDARLRGLHEKRENVFHQLKELVDTAEGESRSFSGEEDASFNRMSDDLDALDASIAKLSTISERSVEVGEMRDRLGMGREVAGNKPTAEPSINEQLRAIARGEQRGMEVNLPTRVGTPAEMRTLLVGTTNAAGTITQEQFVVDLQSALIDRSSLLSIGPRIITTDHANLMEWPRQLTRMATASRVDEAQPIPKPGDPTFDRIGLSARKYAGIAQISHEMIEDGLIDLTPLLVDELAGSVAWAFNLDLYTGDGSNKPYGLLTRAPVGVTGGSAAAPTFDNLIDLEHALKPQFRQGAFFIVNDDTFRLLRKVKATTGEYIYNQGTTGGAPATILGRPFTLDTNMPTVASNAVSVLLGNPKEYWVRQVRSVRLERSDEYAFDTDLVSFKCVFRGGGDLMNLNAFTSYKSAA